MNKVNFRNRHEDGALRACKTGCAVWEELASLEPRRRVSEMRVLVLGFLGHDRGAICSQLRGIGIRSVASVAEISQLNSIRGMSQRFSHVLVNFDAFNCIDDGVDRLLKFRREEESIIVVCVSAFVAMDDLSLERSPICDATLRWPIGEGRLQRALAASLSNAIERSGWKNFRSLTELEGMLDYLW